MQVMDVGGKKSMVLSEQVLEDLQYIGSVENSVYQRRSDGCLDAVPW